MEIISIKCPNCGASITTKTKQCEYCQSDIIVKSFNSLAAMKDIQVKKYIAGYKSAVTENPGNADLSTSIGLCFLRLKQYDEALDAFKKGRDTFDDPAPYFYSAVARLRGKKPFLLLRPDIDQIMTDLKSAIDIEPSPIHYYFMSYIKRDYFKRKFLNTTPTWEEYMQEAVDNGLTATDVEEFHTMIGTPVDIEL